VVSTQLKNITYSKLDHPHQIGLRIKNV